MQSHAVECENGLGRANSDKQYRKAHICVVFTLGTFVGYLGFAAASSLSPSAQASKFDPRPSASLRSLSASQRDKSAMCKSFRPSTSNCDWTNVWQDLFSPDDQPNATCTNLPRRFIYESQDGDMHMAGLTCCKGEWGKLFNPASITDPHLTTRDQCSGSVDFASKVPSDAPVQKYVKQGALKFTMTYGTATNADGSSHPVIKFNGMYDGNGGPWMGDDGHEVKIPPSDCDNIWALLPSESKSGVSFDFE